MADFDITTPFPQLPQRHGLTSTTFIPPLLDGSLTFGELLDSHLTNSSDHPAFIYPTNDGPLKELYWKDYVHAVHRAGRYVNEAFGFDSSFAEKPIVGVLASSDNLTFSAVEVGIIRAECTVFLISTRNSAPALAHLLTKSNSKYLLVTEDLVPLVNAAFDVLEASGEKKPKVAPMPLFAQSYNRDAVEFLPPVKHTSLHDVAIIVHSSGSTAFPKPIPWTHGFVILVCRSMGFGAMDVAGLRLTTQAIPMFHAFGLCALLLMFVGGMVLATNDPTSSIAPPDPNSVIECALETKSDIIICVPLFIETWSRDPQAVEYLSTIKGLIYSGGPLNKAAGDAIAEKGVTLYQIYASSEAGSVNTVVPAPPGMDWEYFSISPHINHELVPDGSGAYELIVLRSPYYMPCVYNTKVNGISGYATNDLLMPHPTKKGHWRVLGRADDQIMHNSGEKTNPGPLETILMQDPQVRSAVMFGRGRFNAGVLIDPKPQYAFDPSNTEQLAEFRRTIWHTVEKMNDYAPQHSRIFKEMVLVSSPSKPFQYTAKMSARKAVIVAEYEPEINAAYEAAEETTQAAHTIPEAWTSESTLSFVRSIVASVLKGEVSDDDDLFQHGCDSLQATWIRNSILHALRATTKLNTRAVQSTFVYQNPSISALTRFILGLVSPSSVGAEISQTSKVEEMLNFVAKYGKNFAVHQGCVPLPVKDTVLVTGTTGAIGSAVLAELAKSTEVARVYALNRKGTTSLAVRQKKALEDRGLDPTIVDSPDVVLVEADLAQPNLGVNKELLEEVAYPKNIGLERLETKVEIDTPTYTRNVRNWKLF